MDWTTPFVPLSQLWWNPAIRPGYSSLTKKGLSEYRSGISTSEEEIARLEKVMAPLFRQKQSVHHICVHNADEIMISERTLYRLIGDGHFSFRNIDLPRKVRWKIRKKKQDFKVDKACRSGRLF